MAKVLVYEQQNIFGEWDKDVQEETVLVVKRKKDGRMLTKKWWKGEEKYTDCLKKAKKFKKRNSFPQTEAEIKIIIRENVKKKMTQEEWLEFENNHLFEQIVMF